MKNKFRITLTIITITGLFFSLQTLMGDQKKDIVYVPLKVELKQENGKYQLYCDGKPFYLKGAGLEFGNMESLAAHGGNSFRTWRINNAKRSGKEVLDEAHKYGLKVCMGIEVGRERHGFDYDNEAEVNAQLEQIRSDVLELKDHPALLMWGIGNELNLRYTNKKVWDAVNNISLMIHEEDPNHLTTTMIAGADKNVIENLKTQCHDLDLLSFQLYGDIVNLPKYIDQSNYQGAYIVSEWGATGHWEVAKTSWGRPIENNTHEKAHDYLERYQKVIASDPDHCIGSFVFLWGQKQERTPTWYGVFLENGDETEAVDVMEYVWTGKYPENRSPMLLNFQLNDRKAIDNIILKDGEKYSAFAEVEDPERDELTYTWKVMREVPDDKKSDGGDFETTPQTVLEISGKDAKADVWFTVPKAGEYRLFVYANDGHGNTATSNIPFLVEKIDK